MPESGKEWEEVPILQLINNDSKEVIAEMHDPEDIRITLIALKDMLDHIRYREAYGSFLAATDVAMHWKYDQILTNHWRATLSTAFLAEGLPYRVYQGNLKHREDFEDISPEEILSRYCYIEDNSSMIEYYYQRLIEIRSGNFLRNGRKNYMLKSMYKWTLLHSYLREVIQGYYRRGHFGIGFILIPDPIYLSDIFTDKGGFEGVKIQMPCPPKGEEEGIWVDFNSLRSLSYYKRVDSGEYEFYKNQILHQFSGLKITGFKMGNDWKDIDGDLRGKFLEVDDPSFYKAGKMDGCYTFHSDDTKFTLTRGGSFFKGTFYGALRRVENSMFFQMTDLTWDLNGAYLDADELLWIVAGSDKDVLSEIENHVFTKDDFGGEESGSKVVRYYGDYTDNEYYTWLDEKPCIWFDNGKASTSRTDDWPEVESFLGKPTKEFNIAVIYAEWKIQSMLEQEFPELMEDRFPKKDGFYLRTKALIGRNTEEAIKYVEQQVRHYLLRRNVFELLEDLFTDKGYRHRSGYLEWSRGLRGEEVPYEGDKWPRFMWNRYQKWENKYKSLLKVKEALLSLRKRISDVEKDPENQVPENLPKYIEVPYTKELFAPSWKTVSPFADVVLSVINYDGDKEQQPEDSTLTFEVRSPKLVYTLLGFYNESQGRGRNWEDFRRTVRSVCHLDDCRFLFLRNYGRNSSLDYRRLSLYANKDNIKISFKGDSTLRIDPAK